MTARAAISSPVWVTTPATSGVPSAPGRVTRSTTMSWRKSSPGVSSSAARTAAAYCARSDWQRGLQTAGPLLVLSIRNWRPVASARVPMRPPRASISRTIWPLPTPPMAGLQDIAPSVSRFIDTSSVRAPRRAAACAASAPAWPPPTTTTS